MMRKLKHMLIMSFVALPIFGLAQEVPFYSGTVNSLIYNPANAGYSNMLESFLHHRSQWTGIKGSPSSQLVSVAAPIEQIHSGIGFSIQNDSRGLFNTLSGSFKYAYHAHITPSSSLSLGLGLDLQNRQFRIGESTVRDVNDPMVLNGTTSETFFDASFGVVYRVRDKFMLGLSVPQLMAGKQGSEASGVQNSRQFMGQLSYLQEISSSGKVKVQPLVVTRYVAGSPFQYDANLFVHYNDKFKIGVGYRSNYALNFHAGVKLNKFAVNYIYDFAAMNADLNTGLSHEIVLAYATNMGKKESIRVEPEGNPGEDDALSEEKIREILNLLIDEFFEAKNNDPDEIKKIEILRETIYELLDSLRKAN